MSSSIHDAADVIIAAAAGVLVIAAFPICLALMGIKVLFAAAHPITIPTLE